MVVRISYSAAFQRLDSGVEVLLAWLGVHARSGGGSSSESSSCRPGAAAAVAWGARSSGGCKRIGGGSYTWTLGGAYAPPAAGGSHHCLLTSPIYLPQSPCGARWCGVGSGKGVERWRARLMALTRTGVGWTGGQDCRHGVCGGDQDIGPLRTRSSSPVEVSPPTSRSPLPHDPPHHFMCLVLPGAVAQQQRCCTRLNQRKLIITVQKGISSFHLHCLLIEIICLCYQVQGTKLLKDFGILRFSFPTTAYNPCRLPLLLRHDQLGKKKLRREAGPLDDALPNQNPPSRVL